MQKEWNKQTTVFGACCPILVFYIRLKTIHIYIYLSFRCWLKNIPVCRKGGKGGGGISDFLESLDEEVFFSFLIFILVEPLQFVQA